MPNWCNNHLVISGPQESIDRIREELKSSGRNEILTFTSHYPLNQDQNPAECWGTKWDACDVEYLEESLPNLSYSFSTAWSPPCGWLEKVVALFPDLSFELVYSEGGVGFYGKSSGSNGLFNDEPMSHSQYLIEYDEFYADIIQEVESFTQEQLIKFFSGVKDFHQCLYGDESWCDELVEEFHWDECPMEEYYPLAGSIIERIETQNLPLFINVNWGKEHNKIFRDRLKEVQNG